MRFPALLLLGFCLLVLTSGVFPTDAADPEAGGISFKVSVVKADLDPFDSANRSNGTIMKVRRGQVIQLVVEGKLKDGYHTGTLNKKGNPEPNQSVTLSPGLADAIAPLSGVKEVPSPEDLKTDEFGNPVHVDKFTWVQEILVLPEAETGPTVLPVELHCTVCKEGQCIIKNAKPKVVIDVSTEPPLPIDPGVQKRIITPISTSSPPAKDSLAAPGLPKQKTNLNLISSSKEEFRDALDNVAKQIEAAKQNVKNTPSQNSDETSDLLAFILAGIFWGAISLITPCVFPMIPITVSFFLKQSETEHHRPVSMALVYSGTIVVVLTLAAAFMLSLFRFLSVDPIMNYVLGTLFVFFALSLFGMYDIELPSGLARFTSAHESKGGYLGTMFMALTFTIISFACVAPFLGGFGGTAAGTARPEWHNLLGGLAFSVTFAAPFFFLAMFPTLLRKMPKSGSWLNSVKVVMGFLELAAAVKFFRLAEIRLTGGEPWLITFDFGLGIYVALCVLCGLYLLGIFRLPHDFQEEHLGVLRMILAGLFLAIGLYLAPALFKNSQGDNLRPHGTLYAWIESFLLPDSSDSYGGNLPAVVAQARADFEKTGKPQRIFLDFTGETCTNCKINEMDVFSKPNIRELFEPFLIVKLYTDTVPRSYYSPELRDTFGGDTTRQNADARVNLAFQRKVFDSETLPTYVILEPQRDNTIKVIDIYKKGRIINEPEFAKFLRWEK